MCLYIIYIFVLEWTKFLIMETETFHGISNNSGTGENTFGNKKFISKYLYLYCQWHYDEPNKKCNISEKRLLQVDAAQEFHVKVSKVFVKCEKQILSLKALQKSSLKLFLNKN